MRRIAHNQQGFTIIELLIATAVFSTVLLLCSYGLLNIGRIYFKSYTTARTQEVARTINADIAQSIQFSGGAIVDTITSNPTDGTKGFCAGGKRYSYRLGDQLVQGDTSAGHSPHGMVVDDIVLCSGATQAQGLKNATNLSTSGPLKGIELLGQNMRLSKISITNAGNNLYNLTVRVAYGDSDLLEDSDGDTILDRCKNLGSLNSGSQFCAVSELSTLVQKRVQ